MSHFTVLVCLDPTDDWQSALDKVLEPFNENTGVEPYRDYEEGRPEDHWYYRYLQGRANDYANGTGIKPYRPNELSSWSTQWSKQTPTEQREEQRQAAEMFKDLASPLTWAVLVGSYNARYVEEDESERLYVDEDGRAYTMSTYNPQSKWDWWQVGGRWSDHFIPRKDVGDEHLIKGKRSWTNENEPLQQFRCDGGRKGALALDVMRDEAAEQARTAHETFRKIVEGTPEAALWPDLLKQVHDNRITIEEARERYHAQPRVQVLRNAPEYRDSYFDGFPLEEFQPGERPYVALKMASAIPGYATLTTDGRWMTKGKMGFWGMDDATMDTTIGYLEAANAYVDSLPDDAWLILVDCHI